MFDMIMHTVRDMDATEQRIQRLEALHAHDIETVRRLERELRSARATIQALRKQLANEVRFQRVNVSPSRCSDPMVHTDEMFP